MNYVPPSGHDYFWEIYNVFVRRALSSTIHCRAGKFHECMCATAARVSRNVINLESTCKIKLKWKIIHKIFSAGEQPFRGNSTSKFVGHVAVGGIQN